MTDITDLHVRYLTQQLASQQAVGQQLYQQGFAEGLRHSRMEIPPEFSDALRYGSAQEHVHVPLDGGHVTIVLARTGSGGVDERREADAWEALERIRLDIRAQVLDGVEFVQRRELPASIAAAIWRRDDRTAVVTSTTTPARPRLRAALRSRRPCWIVVLVVGWGIVRRLGRGLTHALAPSATVAAASAAAVTVIASAPPTSEAPITGERGQAIHGQGRPSPLAYVRPDHAAAPKPKEAPAPDAVAAQTEVPAAPAPPPLPPVDVAPVPTPTPTSPPVETTPAPIEPPTPPVPVPSPTESPTTVSQDEGDKVPSATPEPTPTDLPSPPDGCLLHVFGVDGCSPQK